MERTDLRCEMGRKRAVKERFCLKDIRKPILPFVHLLLVNQRIHLPLTSSPCWQRGSPSVLGQDEDGRHCVVPRCPPPSSVILYCALSSSVVLHCLPPSSPVFRCFPLFSAIPRSPPLSPAVLYSYLRSPGSSCLRSWGSSSLLMTSNLRIQGRGRTTFCRPVSFRGLGSSPTGPDVGPDG